MYVPSFHIPDQRVLTALYTALEAMRVAETKLSMAIDAYDVEALYESRRARRREAIRRARIKLKKAISNKDEKLAEKHRETIKDIRDMIRWDSLGIEAADLSDARNVCRFFASCLQEFATGAPSIGDHVFNSIRDHRNRHEENPAHAEGAILAMLLAVRFLYQSLVLTDTLNGDDFADGRDLIVSAWCALQDRCSLLESSAIGGYGNRALNAITKAQQTQAA